MKREFTITVLFGERKYVEGKVYDLDKETMETLKAFTKEPTKGVESEDSDNSSDNKSTSK